MAKPVDVSEPIPQEGIFDQVDALLEPLEAQYNSDELTAVLHSLKLLRIRSEFYQRYKHIQESRKGNLILALAQKYGTSQKHIEQIIS